MAFNRRVLLAFSIIAISSITPPALARSLVVLQAYEGAALPASEVVRVHLEQGLIVCAVNGRTVIFFREPDVMELPAGTYTIRVAYRRDAGIQTGYSARSAAIGLTAAAGESHRITATVKDNVWSASIQPHAEKTSSRQDERRSVVCWGDQVAGTIEARQRKEKRLTLRLDGMAEPKEWKILAGLEGRTTVLAPPRGGLQAMAAEEYLDGSDRGYSVGQGGLVVGKRVRATYSTCDPATLLEVILEE